MEDFIPSSDNNVKECNAATEDKFKESFKYFKRRKLPPDMSDVLHFGDDFKGGTQLCPGVLSCSEEYEAQALGLIPYRLWKVWKFTAHPGLLIIKNPFTREGQQKWIHDCLTKFPCPPNKTNLDIHSISQSEKTWWEQSISDEGKKTDIKKKLRWATLGYHHNWDTKEYNESMHGDMPKHLVKLCSIVAKVLGYDDFHAEAAIVNYYHLDSSLGPHTDHSEPNRTAPLFSFSFGQNAVFLIGGCTKETKPTAIILRSGDVMIMSGASRLAYHAVPKIVEVPDEPWKYDYSDQSYSSITDNSVICDCDSKSFLKSNSVEYGASNKSSMEPHCIECKSDKVLIEINKPKCKSANYLQTQQSDDMADIFDYVKTSRININVRQVLMPAMKNLHS